MDEGDDLSSEDGRQQDSDIDLEGSIDSEGSSDEMEEDTAPATTSGEDDSSQDHSDSESSCSEMCTSDDSSTSAQSAQQNPTGVFVARSGREWTTREPVARKLPQANILRQRHGIGRSVSGLQTIQECFKLLMTEDMTTVIVTETNRRAQEVIKDWLDKNPGKKNTWKDTDSDELRAFIGLLVLAGVYRSKNESINEMWSLADGRAIFPATMTKNRFWSLLRFCRFDDAATRVARSKDDKLAPIRELWSMLLVRLQECYSPGGSLTVDEQLVSTRGRCSFRQYMPSKPGKYGLKIFWCCDSSTGYPLKGEVYLGRQSGEAAAAPASNNRTSDLVKRLVQPWVNSGRTITMDNFFTDVGLAEDLLAIKTTIVGTVRRNKRDIPKELQPSNKRPEQSSIFCFDRHLTLVSYVPKKRKAVILLSSMHHDKDVNEQNKKKPEIILYYNSTKGGVDRMDQMIRTYSSRRKIKRWPMTFFFNMIDVAAVAAFIIWIVKNPMWNHGRSHRRRIFLLELGKSLLDTHLQRRSQQTFTIQQRSVRLSMQVIGLTAPASLPISPLARVARQRCRYCPRERDRKVVTRCVECHAPCCPDHQRVFCNTCANVSSQ
jgi:hypothetical protein